MRRFLAIAVIWLGCAAAWLVLGSALVVRSGDATGRLGSEVHQLWGPPMEQKPPTATAELPAQPKADPAPKPDTGAPPASRDTEAQAPAEQNAPAGTAIPLAGSDIKVDLALEHRRKGLVWFPTYAVTFDARYSFGNPTDKPQTVDFSFPLERENALYDGFEVLRADGSSADATVADGVATWRDVLAPHQQKSYRVKYRSRGTERFTYALASGTGQVKDFRLALTSDVSAVDFPAGTLSPSSKQLGTSGFSGEWKFKTLVSSSPIGVELPQKINPGPLAARITFFAPVGLLFFFFVVAVLSGARAKAMHPMHFFFLGTAFFAFHLLFSYLVDHSEIAPSFAIASGVSLALVVSYARLFVGWRFALREIGVSQALYLVLFSLTFFWPGFTGLSITVGAILTLFVMMQLTGRKNWDDAEKRHEAPAGCVSPYRCAPSVTDTPLSAR